MNETYKGAQTPNSAASQFNALTFLVTQILAGLNVAMPVKVLVSTNDGGLSAVGSVDVQPLISQVDGYGKSYLHAPIYGLPYFRMQGGANAIILDPQPGDIGVAIFADRDISAVKANKGAALPGSSRRFDMADGMYLGGILNGLPSQYFRFSQEGIDIVSPTKITISAPEIAMQSTTFTHNGVNVGDDHDHGGVSRGSDFTDGPS